uniref:BAG domain-containing protein n=1 Tax=Chrysotila carterae TaxID=13221 RepID=A0A7S4BWA8_CHRCT
MALCRAGHRKSPPSYPQKTKSPAKSPARGRADGLRPSTEQEDTVSDLGGSAQRKRVAHHSSPRSRSRPHAQAGSHAQGRPPAVERKLSKASAQTTTELYEIASELAEMELLSKEAQRTLNTSSELPPTLRNDLAQLHGNANKLIATRLDAIITGDLHSGRDEARSMRKQLIQQTEALIERVEAQVKAVDERRPS